MGQVTNSDSMSAPLSARRENTRQRLLVAASTIFATKGVGGASVEEISEAAGFTRGAFYSNFESKDALCFALLRSISDSSLAAVRLALAAFGSEPTDAGEPLDAAVDIFLATQPPDRESLLLLLEMELYAIRHPGFAGAYAALREETHGLFADVIEGALARQGLTLALPAHQVIEILHAVHDSVRAAALLQPSRPDPVAGTLKALVTALIR
jgi:AcrR family transcriptional regulator